MGYLKIMQDEVMEYIERNVDKLEHLHEITPKILMDMFDVIEYGTTPDQARKLVLANIDDVMEAGSYYAYNVGSDCYTLIGKALCSGDFQYLDRLARYAFLNDAIDDVVNALFKRGGKA